MNKRHIIVRRILTLVFGLTSVALLQTAEKKGLKNVVLPNYSVQYSLSEGVIIGGAVSVVKITPSTCDLQTCLYLPSDVVLRDGLGRSNALIQLPSTERIKKNVSIEGEAYREFIQRSRLANELGGKRLDGVIAHLAIKRAVAQDVAAGNNLTIIDVDTLIASIITDQQLAKIHVDYDKIQEKMEGAVVAQIEQ